MRTPVRILLDTDMLCDCDDLGALAMLHALADRAEAEIPGVALNGHDEYGRHGAVVSAVNCFYGRDQIPIGVSKRGPDTTPSRASNYSREIFDEFEHDGLLDSQRGDAVDLYRDVLSAQPEGSVVIVSIGFLSNLEDVLRSDGGAQLLADRVREISIMGGDYPQGKEYNFRFGGTGAATTYVLDNLPPSIAVTYTGCGFGRRIITGTGYKTAPPSPMRRGYELAHDAINVGRPSCDQLATLYGVRGLGFGDQAYFRRETGINLIDAEGRNTWRAEGKSIHGFLTAAMPDAELAAVIEALMLARPDR